MHVRFDLRWSIAADGESRILEPLVFELLRGVRDGGHLRYAAGAAGVSYRHAWGLLREWEGLLGTPLLATRQGRGAHLTALAEALLETAADTATVLGPRLASAALDAAARLTTVADPRQRPVAIVSSHSERVAGLRKVLEDRYRVTLDVSGSEQALQRLRRREADIAGFHLPMGKLGRTVAARLIGMLDASRDQVWLLEKRALGLLSRPAEPVRTLAELAGRGVQFINRQPGSGTRLTFDALLEEAGIAPDTIAGYGDTEYTHTAVAALVASGGADAAFASAAAAEHMKLHFEPLVDERFYLAVHRDVDSSLRQAVGAYCAAQTIPGRQRMKPDEFEPSIAALKRVHRAGFWKQHTDPPLRRG